MADYVTYYAALPTSEDGARSAAVAAGWSYDEDISRSSPPNVQVISLRQPIEGRGELSQVGIDVQEQLQEALDVRPAAIVARVGGKRTGVVRSNYAPRSQWDVKLLPTELDPGVLSSIIDGVFLPAHAPPGADGTLGSGGDGAASKQPGAPAAALDAGAISAVLSTLVDPSKLWEYVDEQQRGEIAATLVQEAYGDRSRLSRRGEWMVSPEMFLIEVCPEDRRPELAEQLLRVRGKITDADAQTRGSNAALVAKEVDLAAQRVALAEQGVAIAGEMLAQMKKWREIAKLGLIVLCVTTAFSMLAVGYVLAYLVPGGKIGEAAAPIVIFVLALFAVSPAVLLLRERPLEGIDKWSPGGKEPSGGDGSGGTSQAKASAAGDSAGSAKSAKPAR